jgi:hypothetical protein
MYELRTLDPTKDEALFQEAYSWIMAQPDWFQYLEGVVATVNNCYSYTDYLKAAMKETEVNIGLFNGRLRAVYTIQDQKDGSFQVHVGAEQDVDQMALVAGAIRLREWLFAHGAREVFGWLASVNRPMKKFAEEAGFHYCGLSVFKGSLNDRPIRWLRFSAAR